MSIWPRVLWAGTKTDRVGGKHRGPSGDLCFQISFRIVWVTFPVCTSSCTCIFSQTSFTFSFLFLQKLTDVVTHLWKCFLFSSFVHPCSILGPIFFQVNSQGHAAISSCWGCSLRGAWMIKGAAPLLSINRIYCSLVINDAGLQQRWLLCTWLGCLGEGLGPLHLQQFFSVYFRFGDKKVKNCLATSSIWFLSPLLRTLLVWPEKPGIVPKAIKKNVTGRMKILSCALKTSFHLIRMSPSCQTWLVPVCFSLPPPH